MGDKKRMRTLALQHAERASEIARQIRENVQECRFRQLVQTGVVSEIRNESECKTVKV